jgi:hypothetical protein
VTQRFARRYNTVRPMRLQGAVMSSLLRLLRVVWIVAIVLSATGLLAVFFEKHIPLCQELETSFGLDAKGEKTEADARMA